jgi:hypothetical protein
LLPLYENLVGTATFSTLERWLLLSFMGDSWGHVTLAGQVSARPGNTLGFRLELDQTYLKPVIEGIRELLAVFPVGTR